MAMMTAPELLDWLGKSLLLTATQVDELRPQLTSWPDGHALAKELITRNWLTPYQVNQILQGKGETLILGPNRLLERIGEGAMGQVYKAWNARLDRVVAVKMIHKEHIENAKAMDRFRREVKTASQLDHPNIVLVRDADEADGRPYLVMDFIEGEDLSQRVKRDGPLPLAEAVDFVRQAALGLQHAFEKGVVHRDIKPGNLMLESSRAAVPDAAGASTVNLPPVVHQVRILDFGLARDNDDPNAKRLTQMGNILGTVDYIAPEQAHDARTVDTRADIYGLGCTLFYLLTGKPPFLGATLVEKITARMSNAPPSLRAVRPEVPAGLDAVVQRMMARRPEDRYQAPIHVAQALAPFTRVGHGEDATATLSSADIAAAMTARKLAQAIPLQEPAPADAPVVQAFSVADPNVGAAIPVATPVAAPLAVHSGAEPEVRPGGATPVFTDSTSGSGAMPALPVAAVIPGSANQQGASAGLDKRLFLYIAGVIGAVTVVGVIILLVVGNRRPPAPPKRGYFHPGAGLNLLPLDPIVVKEGARKPIIVKIQRKEFYGPVIVRFEDLPDGLSSKEITLTDKQDTSQLYLTISFTTPAMKRDLRLVAIAENLQDSTILSVTVENDRKK